MVVSYFEVFGKEQKFEIWFENVFTNFFLNIIWKSFILNFLLRS